MYFFDSLFLCSLTHQLSCQDSEKKKESWENQIKFELGLLTSILSLTFLKIQPNIFENVKT
jgi:hypothetical protein